MSTMKPKEIQKMYDKYIKPPFENELKKNGQTLGPEVLEDESELIKTLSDFLNNKIERKLLAEPEMRKEMEKILTMALTSAVANKKDPNGEDNLKKDIEGLLSRDPKQMFEAIKNIMLKCNEQQPNDKKLSAEEFKKSLKETLTKFNDLLGDNKLSPEGLNEVIKEIEKDLTTELVGDKVSSPDKSMLPTPSPDEMSGRGAKLVDSSGVEMLDLGVSDVPTAVTVEDLLEMETSEETDEFLRKSSMDPSMTLQYGGGG